MKNEPVTDTDAELLARFEQGRDQCAFTELVRRHGPMVMSFALQNLNNIEDARDAFQATFFALARSAGSIKKTHVVPWLYTAVRRTSATIRRTNARRESKHKWLAEANMIELNHEIAADAEKDNAAVESATILHEEIAKLPDRLQAVVLLCHMEGKSHREAARELSVASSTVTDRLYKARTRLRAQLIRRGVTLSAGLLAKDLLLPSESIAAINPALVNSTVQNSLLYAAGRTSARIGVSTTVVDAANRTLQAYKAANMFAAAFCFFGIVAIAGAAYFGASATVPQTGTIFDETFDDADLFDNEPVSWRTNNFFPGNATVSGGDLVISPLPDAPAENMVGIDVAGPLHRDTSIRTRMRVTQTGGSVTISVRVKDTPQGPLEGYFAGIGYHDAVGGSFLVAGRINGLPQPDNRVFFSSNDGTAFRRLSHDVRRKNTEIRFDAIGDEFKVWAWPASGVMPPIPQFDVKDDNDLLPGRIAIVLSNTPPGDGQSRAIVSFIRATRP